MCTTLCTEGVSQRTCVARVTPQTKKDTASAGVTPSKELCKCAGASLCAFDAALLCVFVSPALAASRSICWVAHVLSLSLSLSFSPSLSLHSCTCLTISTSVFPLRLSIVQSPTRVSPAVISAKRMTQLHDQSEG